MKPRYAVRVEHFGRLIRERWTDALGAAATLRRTLSDDEANRRFSITIYRPDNIDLGCPTGLTQDEEDSLEEML